MTVFAPLGESDSPAAPARPRSTGSGVMQALLRILGLGAMGICLAFWLSPGASWEPDVMLFKLILSVITGIAGLGLLQASMPARQSEVEIDLERQELRLMRRVAGGGHELLHRCQFDDLQRADLRGTHLRLWGVGGRLLAEVTVSNRRAVAILLDKLRDAGKLS
ncbi:MAG: hypothetical protein ACSHWZ_15335 [Sulfitobacter sp.]